MRKFSLLIALAMLASGILLSPPTANAQDDKQAQQQQFERDWYEICFGAKKDNEKCYQLSKELAEKYPGSTYVENSKKIIKNYDQNKAWEKFNAALQAYYKAPDTPKLEQLFSAGDEYLKFQPDQQYVIAQMALAGGSAVLAQVYKNMDKVKALAEKALKAMEPTAPPKDWEKPTWDALREAVMSQMNQYLGYYLTETKGDSEQALSYLAKAIQVKGKDGAGWKDPNNYWLRSTVYSNQYVQLRAEYDKLTDEEKNAEKGKEILKKVNELLDTKLIPEYARVLATAATKPEAKGLHDLVKPEFDQLWKYRTDAPEKAADYIKNYVNDPTITTVPIPAKAETADNLNAPAAPVVGAGNVKLASGGAPVAPGGAKASANGNGKATKTKGKAPAKNTKTRKRRG
jgi:hypothetical protein